MCKCTKKYTHLNYIYIHIVQHRPLSLRPEESSVATGPIVPFTPLLIPIKSHRVQEPARALNRLKRLRAIELVLGADGKVARAPWTWSIEGYGTVQTTEKKNMKKKTNKKKTEKQQPIWCWRTGNDGAEPSI